jgi:PAS domain S-box-containing protein
MVLSDISERKRAEGALRESEAHYRALVESQCDMVCRWRPDSTLVFVNTAYCDFFGKTRDELLGKTWLDLVPESARAAVRRQYEEIARHPVTHEYEHQVTVADGTCRWQAWSGIPTFDASGRLLEFQSVGRDVTARKRDEDALRASESRLRYLAVELSRVEERERQRLAVCLHDEVAQALALLRLKLGALAATLGAETAQAQVEPLRDLLERTIDQTRSLVFDLSPPILYELGLAAALEWVGEKIGRDYDLAFVCRHDGGPRVLDDELNVLLFRCAREVMMNTVRHARATRLAVVLERQGGGVRVSLEDDGCGFELSSLDRRRREVGFGLFSVRERLAAVGGRCEIESAPGRGTRVTLTVSALPPK